MSGQVEMDNAALAAALLELGDMEKAAGRVHKHNAYVAAAAAISAAGAPVRSGAAARALDGVGVKIAAKIDELLTTGRLGALERRRADPTQQALTALTAVHGVGPATARAWLAQGIATLAALERAVADKRVAVTREQALGLQYRAALAERVPRAEVARHAARLRRECAAVDTRLRVEIVGSFRRQRPTCGDIDVLLVHPAYTRAQRLAKQRPELVARVVARLKASGYVVEQFSSGAVKFMGVCRLDEEGAQFRHLDIKLLPLEAAASGLLHFTGSGQSNRVMRVRALKLGMTLSEFGLQPVGETGENGPFLRVDTEKDIFDWLGLPFVPPEERNL